MSAIIVIAIATVAVAALAAAAYGGPKFFVAWSQHKLLSLQAHDQSKLVQIHIDDHTPDDGSITVELTKGKPGESLTEIETGMYL